MPFECEECSWEGENPLVECPWRNEPDIDTWIRAPSFWCPECHGIAVNYETGDGEYELDPYAN
jgi:hypothetical protein